jgi:tyrosine decarboxylase/aspartate 1-decarboxylase
LFWAVKGATVAESSAKAQAIFDEARRRDLYLALADLPGRFFPAGTWPDSTGEGAQVTCLRSVMMKPEHLTWLDEIWRRLDVATEAVNTR